MVGNSPDKSAFCLIWNIFKRPLEDYCSPWRNFWAKGFTLELSFKNLTDAQCFSKDHQTEQNYKWAVSPITVAATSTSVLLSSFCSSNHLFTKNFHLRPWAGTDTSAYCTHQLLLWAPSPSWPILERKIQFWEHFLFLERWHVDLYPTWLVQCKKSNMSLINFFPSKLPPVGEYSVLGISEIYKVYFNLHDTFEGSNVRSFNNEQIISILIKAILF